MDNDLIYKNVENNQTTNPNLFCNRCKMREADFTCDSCDPFRYFCANCDGYVHSSTTKRLHVRNIVEKVKEKILNIDFDNIKSFSTNHRSIGNNLDNSYVVKNTFNNNNTRSNLMSVEYVNMKTIDGNSYVHSPSRQTRHEFQFEKEQLLDKISSLERQLENVQNIMNENISALEIQIEENNKKYNLNMKILNDQNALEMRKIISEKDCEIRNLIYKNSELQKINSELNLKLEQNNSKLSQIEVEFKEYLNRNELSLKKREYEFEELKGYNEDKIKVISEGFAQEKTKLINYYERNIDKLNSGYRESKDKYLNLLAQREDDIKEILYKMRTEENKYNEIINSLKSEISKLREDNSYMTNQNKNQKQEINTLRENLEKTRKDLKFFINQSKSFEEESKNLIQEKEEMKTKFEKLHRITHGKFKNANI